MKEKDSLLFDIGLNTCNIELLQDLISQEFTFYHDQSGITKSKDAFIESVQNEQEMILVCLALPL